MSSSSPLPADVAKAIRSTARRLEKLDPHALIGVERNATWSDIERAYRERLATFHPSHWSGYDLEGLRPSMETITTRIGFAFAYLAEEAARTGALEDEGGGDRTTEPLVLDAVDLELTGERKTFPQL